MRLVRQYLRMACVLLILAATGGAAVAQEARLFTTDSLAEIAAARTERPFILSFWSTTCAHCRDELALLGQLRQQHPTLDIVLVSTDTPEELPVIRSTLAEFKLDTADSWVFADSFAERLRFAVDRKWHGELPRTYFYVPGEARQARSGKLDVAALKQWIEHHVGPVASH